MEFANENKWQWMRPYRAVSRWIGWILIFFGCLDLIGSFYNAYHEPHIWNEMSFSDLFLALGKQSWFILRDKWMPGILALGVAQFLHWLIDQETKPGWLLRHAPRLLLFAAFVYLIQAIWLIFLVPSSIRFFRMNSPQGDLLNVIASVIIPNLLMRIVPVIILFGLAEAMRRMGPIIDESKSTV